MKGPKKETFSENGKQKPINIPNHSLTRVVFSIFFILAKSD